MILTLDQPPIKFALSELTSQLQIKFAIKEAHSGKSNSTTLIDSEGNTNKDQFKKLTNETLMNRNKS